MTPVLFKKNQFLRYFAQAEKISFLTVRRTHAYTTYRWIRLVKTSSTIYSLMGLTLNPTEWQTRQCWQF